jgi:hypothetical protein
VVSKIYEREKETFLGDILVFEANISLFKIPTISHNSHCGLYIRKRYIYSRILRKRPPRYTDPLFAEKTVILWTKKNNLEYKIPRK